MARQKQNGKDHGTTLVLNENPHGADVLSMLTRPERVAIVALGVSAQAFVMEAIHTGTTKANPFDEIWTVNRGFRGFRHDKLFVMDDFRWLEQRDPAYAEFLKHHDKPVVTSTVYPDYPASVEYPLQEVISSIGDDAFAVNTVAYMVAYALHIGVKEMSIYGADFIYPNGNQSEKGGQAVAYLLGIAKERKINFRIPQTSTLLYSNTVKVQGNKLVREYYGYHRKEEKPHHGTQVARDSSVRGRPEHGQGAPGKAEPGAAHQAPAH